MLQQWLDFVQVHGKHTLKIILFMLTLTEQFWIYTCKPMRKVRIRVWADAFSKTENFLFGFVWFLLQSLSYDLSLNMLVVFSLFLSLSLNYKILYEPWKFFWFHCISLYFFVGLDLHCAKESVCNPTFHWTVCMFWHKRMGMNRKKAEVNIIRGSLCSPCFMQKHCSVM